MNAHSEHLRKKIVAALRRETGKSLAPAHAFGVSLSSVKRYARMADKARPEEEARGFPAEDRRGRQAAF